MNLKDLAIKHPYYANDCNYYSNDAGAEYSTWADFYEEFEDADVDMNLFYRWDINKRDKRERYYMQVFIIGKRKVLYVPIQINYVEEKDVPQIIEFMKPHFEKLLELWKPLTQEFISQK